MAVGAAVFMFSPVPGVAETLAKMPALQQAFATGGIMAATYFIGDEGIRMITGKSPTAQAIKNA